MGDKIILLKPGKKQKQSENYQSANVAFVLYTDDLNQAMNTYRDRGLVFNGNDGPDCPTFTDLDGNWFQLVNPKHV